jgi:hypothetical protein
VVCRPELERFPEVTRAFLASRPYRLRGELVPAHPLGSRDRLEIVRAEQRAPKRCVASGPRSQPLDPRGPSF